MFQRPYNTKLHAVCQSTACDRPAPIYDEPKSESRLVERNCSLRHATVTWRDEKKNWRVLAGQCDADMTDFLSVHRSTVLSAIDCLTPRRALSVHNAPGARTSPSELKINCMHKSHSESRRRPPSPMCFGRDSDAGVFWRRTARHLLLREPTTMFRANRSDASRGDIERRYMTKNDVCVRISCNDRWHCNIVQSVSVCFYACVLVWYIDSALYSNTNVYTARRDNCMKEPLEIHF